MSAGISCHYVEAAGRLVHYRVCGSGPAIVLLHDSPRSSRLHIPLMQHLSDRFQVFAIDTPGYGDSDPIGMESPGIADFAEALGLAIAAIGIGHAPVYATHTSAKIALALAVRGGTMPLLMLDGLSIPAATTPEAFIDQYMRPFKPEPTGAWIAAEWSRTRDMLRWFPWFAVTAANRIPMEPPSADWMEDYGIDLFSAGPHYADAYAAAMRWNPMADLVRVPVPTVIGARSDDVLYAHLDKVPCAENRNLSVERLGPDRDTWVEWIARTLGMATDQLPAPLPDNLAGADLARGYVDLDGGQLHWRSFGKAAGRPILALSGPTTLEAERWARALAPHRRVIVPDLPGHGNSDPLREATPDAMANALAALVEALDLGAVDVLAIDLLSPLGAHFASRHPQHVASITVQGAPPVDTADVLLAGSICPPIEFDALAGSHLHRIWHMLRDSQVQFPWNNSRPNAARPLLGVSEAADLHRALTGVLKQRRHYDQAVRASLSVARPEIWRAISAPVLVCEGNDPAMGPSADLLALAPRARNMPITGLMDADAVALVTALDQVAAAECVN